MTQQPTLTTTMSPLRKMMCLTRHRGQKWLALAYHLKTAGNQPILYEELSLLEQEAAAKLARDEYPLTPAAERKLRAQAQVDDSNELSVQEQLQSWLSIEDARECFPRMMPPSGTNNYLLDMLAQRQPNHRPIIITALATIALIAAVWVITAFLSPSYTGVVSDLKAERSGMLIDLDGAYPHQRMTAWVTLDACRMFHGHCPTVGTTLEVSGPSTSYHGRSEIVVHDASQLRWPGGPTVTEMGPTNISSDDDKGALMKIDQADVMIAAVLDFMVAVAVLIGITNWVSPSGPLTSR